MAKGGQHMVHVGLNVWVRFRGYRLAPRDLRIGGVPYISGMRCQFGTVCNFFRVI